MSPESESTPPVRQELAPAPSAGTAASQRGLQRDPAASSCATPEPGSPPDGHWSARKPAEASVAYVLAYLGLSLGGSLLSKLRLPTAGEAVLALTVATGTLAFSLLLVLSISRLKLRPGSEVAWLVGMMVLFFFARPDVFAIAGRWLGSPGRGREIAELLKITPEQQLFGNIALILWAVFLGRLVSRVIREGKLLLPVAVVASIADIITVFWGVVAHLTEKAPEVVEAFSTRAPVPPPPVSLPVLTSVGLGDFMFLAVFLTVVARYTMNAARALWFTLVLMLVAPLAFWVWPKAPGMPGLPFISLAVLGANWRYLRFTRDEKRALVFAGALVAIVTAWIVLSAIWRTK